MAIVGRKQRDSFPSEWNGLVRRRSSFGRRGEEADLCFVKICNLGLPSAPSTCRHHRRHSSKKSEKYGAEESWIETFSFVVETMEAAVKSWHQNSNVDAKVYFLLDKEKTDTKKYAPGVNIVKARDRGNGSMDRMMDFSFNLNHLCCGKNGLSPVLLRRVMYLTSFLVNTFRRLVTSVTEFCLRKGARA